MAIKEGIEAMFADDNNVFVAGKLPWYPIEGEFKTRIAPDTMIVFGRPKGERNFYHQWREDGIAPQVIFEVTSLGNQVGEASDWYRFCCQHGVEEYYFYDSFNYEFRAWVRPQPDSPFLEPVDFGKPFISPRLGVRFVPEEQELRVFAPSGEQLLTFVELWQTQRSAEQRASAEAERAERLAAQLRALGIDPQL